MPAARTTSVLHNNITLTAGAANTTSASQTVSTRYATQLLIKITNGATGPSTPAQCQVQVSADNTNWYGYGGALVAGTTNNAVYDWTVAMPIDAQGIYVRTVSGSNVGQNVTLRVELITVNTI